jgi:hypothetical protein
MTQDNKTAKTAPAKTAKPAPALTLAALQAQIAALQAQAAEVAAIELQAAKDKFQKMNFVGLGDMPEEFIVEFLGKIQQELKMPESRRIIVNATGVYVKDNAVKDTKGNAGNAELTAKPMLLILDANGKAVGEILDRGPISERLYGFAKEIPEYATMSYLEFKKQGIKKATLCRRLSDAFPSKYRFVGKED